MAALNPMQLIMMLKNNNPQPVAEQIITQNYSNNPQMLQLLEMGKQGDMQGLEQIANKILSQQGKDFNTEMNNLLGMVKNL